MNVASCGWKLLQVGVRCGSVCGGYLWARPQAVPLGRPEYAKRVTERVDQSRDYVFLSDVNFDAELSGFGCLPTSFR